MYTGQGNQLLLLLDDQLETLSVAGAAGLILLCILILSLGAIIMGIMTHKLAKRKGYSGYFWTGFFFRLTGLIYVVGLPDNRYYRNNAVDNRDEY